MNIGFIGLGIMGESMCENIIKKHNGRVYCFDINKNQKDKLAALGGIACDDGIEVAKNSDIIISMVPRSEHSFAVYKAILDVLNKDKICIDMSTIDPSVSVEISKMVKKTGAQFADAPVVKSKPAAITGELGILVGCDESLYEIILPVLKYMGTNVIRMGENGKGLVMKVCHNALVAQIQNGVNETLTLAKKNGINFEDFAKAISYGGGQNFYLDGQWPKLMNDDYSVAFSFENEHKDLGICQRLAEESGINMPGMENAKRIYDEGMTLGLGKEDFRATYKIVRGDYKR